MLYPGHWKQMVEDSCIKIRHKIILPPSILNLLLISGGKTNIYLYLYILFLPLKFRLIHTWKVLLSLLRWSAADGQRWKRNRYCWSSPSHQLNYLEWVSSLDSAQDLNFRLGIQRGVVPGGAGGAMTPQILANQLSLSQPGGDRLCPPNYYWHSQIFRPSDSPDSK